MGRWIYQRHNQYSEDVGKECVVIVDEKNNTIAKRVLGEDGPEQFPFIKDSHNADCDAYEKRIAELEAKLALLQDTVPKDSMINLSTNEGQWMLSVWRILYPVETRT